MPSIDYKIRCDKHQFKPYEYCEMCMIRNMIQDAIQDAIQDNREMVQRQCAHMQICLNDINDILDNHKKQIKLLIDKK